MEKYSFFDAVVNDDGVYDRVYKAEDIAAYFSSFIGNGVYPNPSTNLQIISANDGMKIKAKVGKAWINGYYYENTEEIVFKLDNADAQYDRIDAVVLRLDFLERTITLQIKKGTTAIKPIAPTLQRDADAYELKIAEIYVSKGVVDITDIVITDTRQLSDVCGLVSGVVEQINVDDLFLQYNSAFDTWFEHIKDQLTEDAAGNLQAQIDNLNKSVSYLYKAIFAKNSWIGEGPYTQAATLTAVDGGGQVTAQSTLLACVGIDSTLPQETKDAMQSAASDIVNAEKTLGANTISVSLTNKPDVEIELYFLIKEGNGSNIPPLNPIGAGGSGMKLLWENPTPTAQFNPQTISLDLSGYDGVVVTGRFNVDTNDGGVPAIMFNKDVKTQIIFPSGYMIRWRYASWNESGVTFEEGRVDSYNSGTGGTPDNRWAIPMKIFGIKL